MYDILFIILIALFVPVIVITGVRISGIGYQKVLKGLTIAFLAAEILRFFVNASLYENAATPKGDLKFGIITVLCVLAMFATFYGGSFSAKVLRPVFALTALSPVIFAIMLPVCYVNPLDVSAGALCKACYMVECGIALTVAIIYFNEGMEDFFNPLNIIWAALLIGVYAGVDAFIIWCWQTGVKYDYIWFLNYALILVSVGVIFSAVLVYRRVRLKKQS